MDLCLVFYRILGGSFYGSDFLSPTDGQQLIKVDQPSIVNLQIASFEFSTFSVLKYEHLRLKLFSLWQSMNVLDYSSVQQCAVDALLFF